MWNKNEKINKQIHSQHVAHCLSRTYARLSSVITR